MEGSLDERVRNAKRKRAEIKAASLEAAVLAKKKSVTEQLEAADDDYIIVTFINAEWSTEKSVIDWLRGFDFDIMEDEDDNGVIIPRRWVVQLA